ncbi:MAG: phospholipid/cholesterol/gamma-HCH transport system substrate-binding protein [Actinomycetota bacterium]|jgi:virulence factor Mce-like protein|nr:phospholipid/cholesterol/gamma-HCH transport system substrate-binding protein [Actinomycetota bacterium]
MIRQRLLGLLLVGLLVGGIALSIALYNKSFSSFVTVTLKADSIGNQLLKQSDVKVRGLIVGSVSEIASTSEGAELTLQLDPASALLIPENVSARFLPKTLFGERFVSLELPDQPSARTLQTGDVIPQDRTSSAVELEQAFTHLLPVLQAVQPQKLSSTLTAISTALQGRGEPLGETLSQLGQYIGDLNPHVPQLEKDLQALTTFSDNLKNATPDLVQSLDNLSTTTRTVVDQQQNLSLLYGNLTTAAVDLQSFLQANSGNIIRLAETARPTAELLAKYAPEYPCVIGQMAQTVPKIDQAMGKGTDNPGLHATIEITTTRGPYIAGKDEPKFEDKRGPRCYDMKQFPVPFPQNPPDGPIQDGSTQKPPARSVNDGLLPSNTAANAGTYNGSGTSGGNPAYSAGEKDFLSQLIGPQVGMDAADVPGWSSLLVGPLYRGAEVTIK